MPTHSHGLYAGPVRRPLSADSDFFDAGNTNRALLCKVNVFAIINRGDEFTLDGECHECMFHGCSAVFPSLKRHEEHYETSHRNRCSFCERSFPTHRLLDLHLSETHDSFFMALAERRPMYRCLVEGCSEIFDSPDQRHEHLVDAHRYPNSFDFSRPSYSRKKTRTKVPTGGRESVDLSAAGGRRTTNFFMGAPSIGEECDPESPLAAAKATTAAAATRVSSASQSPVFSLMDERSRNPHQSPGSASVRACTFRHATRTMNGGGRRDGGGGGEGWRKGGEGADAMKNGQGETPHEVDGLASCPRQAETIDCGGAGARHRSGSGKTCLGVGRGWSGFSANQSGDGGAPAAWMEEVNASGGVDELINGMNMLLVPRHLRVGRPAR